MAMTGNVITLNLDWQTLLLWAFVGLVAGFLASHVMLGHGMGLVGDVVIGVIGGIGANLLANALNVRIVIPGHPIISQIVIASVDALLLAMGWRLFRMGCRWGPT